MAPAALLRLPLWIAFLISGAGVNILGFLGNRILDNPTSRLAPREMPEPTKVTSISAGMKRDVGAVRNDLEKNGYASDPERVVAGEMPDPPKILFPVDVEHAIGIVGRELEKRSREHPACFRKFWQTTYCQVVESPSRIAWSPATIAQTKRRPAWAGTPKVVPTPVTSASAKLLSMPRLRAAGDPTLIEANVAT